MNSILENFLNNYKLFDIDNSEKLDLTNKEDVQKFHEKIDELRKNDAFLSLTKLFGYDLADELDALDEFADKTYEKTHENDNNYIDRPSTKLTTEQGLQVHKLVQEYVDSMIKPYNYGQLSNDQINDAYAGLYEFAAWILNKK